MNINISGEDIGVQEQTDIQLVCYSCDFKILSSLISGVFVRESSSATYFYNILYCMWCWIALCIISF